MYSIDQRDIQRFERDLKTFKSRALPFATRNTINTGAFTAQKTARDNVREQMITRNRFAVQSVQVRQARTLRIADQAAVVGSVADFMEAQEFGTTKAKTGKEGVAIPTSYSSGEGQETTPRQRLPRKPNKLANIALQRRRKRGSSRKQQNLIAIRQAAASGRKYVFLDLVRRKGIFRVVGGRRRPRIKMVHDLTQASVVIPANPWLLPAVVNTQPLMAGFYQDSLRFQMQKHRLFRS